MDKKNAAKLEALRGLAKSKKEKPDLAKKLEGKKLSKVTVMSDSKEGLEKGLTKAQQILKAKLGEKLGLEPKEDDTDEETCPVCDGEGCEECEEEAEEA